MNQSITPKNFTDEQINMFVQGSEAFWTASLFAEERFKTLFPRIDDLYPSKTVPASNAQLYKVYSILRAMPPLPGIDDLYPGEIIAVPKAQLFHVYSFMNAMSSNFGMALELKLKCIQYFTLNGILKDHSLENLFDCLEPTTKDTLSNYYQEWITQCPYEKKFIKYVHSENQIVEPSITPIENFKGLLKFFDEIGLYDRRFAFENFEPNEWEHAVLPSSFQPLINKINGFISGFGIKPSPSKNYSFFVPHMILETESADEYYEKWGSSTYQIDPSSGNLTCIDGNFSIAKSDEPGHFEANPIIEYSLSMLDQKEEDD